MKKKTKEIKPTKITQADLVTSYMELIFVFCRQIQTDEELNQKSKQNVYLLAAKIAMERAMRESKEPYQSAIMAAYQALATVLKRLF